MRSGSQGISEESEYKTVTARTVEAISWFDRARIRQRRQQLPKFQSEVQAPTSQTDLAGLAEQAARDLYKPTMGAKGRHMKTIQEDLSEQAAEGGRGIGRGKHSYEAPANNLADMDGMRFTGLGNIPLLGKLFSLIRSNPRAARLIATPQRVERGTFSVRVASTIPAQYSGPYDRSTGKPVYPNQLNSPYWTPARKTTRDVDLVDIQSPGALSAEERSSLDPFTASLLGGADGARISPQQILKLHDQLQAGGQVSLKAGPNGADWMNRVMGSVGETLRADAARIGAVNLVAKLFQMGTLITSALGLAVAAGTMGYSMAKINPSNEQIAPTQRGYNPYAATTNSDPAAAFDQQSQVQPGAQQPMASPTPAPYQPFGAVNQNFGNLSVPSAPGGGVGAMPSVTPSQNGVSPYGWTRINSVISRMIFS